jgi:hypothetical protein
MPLYYGFIILFSRYDMSKHRKDELSLRIVPFGPSQNVIDRISTALIRNKSMQKYLGRSKYRLLYFELIDSDAKRKKKENNKGKHKPLPPNRFHATLFDYTNNRTIFVDGSIDKPRHVEITESAIHPLPTKDEFDEAVKVLMENNGRLRLQS